MLEKYHSICEKHQKIIVSEENNRVHRAINNESYLVRQYHIDGEVITEGKRCDYLVLNDTKKNAYFIELKGSDVNRGIEQLFASIDLIRDDIDEYNIMLRMVYNKSRTIRLNSTAFRKVERDYPGRYLFAQGKIEENL